ncbi:MAG: hypothetical protein ACQUHE_18315 [Bacteroidia bacterium]
MKILITGGKSALALRLLKAFTQDQVVFADYGEMPSFSSSTYSFISLGEKNVDTIAHTLLNHCLNVAVDFFLPLHSFEIIPVAKAEVLFREFGIELLLPSLASLTPYGTFAPSPSFINWVVFKNGISIYSSLMSNALHELPETSSLNGVYYVDGNDVANLKLITI